jgi:hypothetical protein
MKSLFRPAILTLAIIGLSACASAPDPAEICSAEWIAPRADKAVAKIQKRAGSSINKLSNVSRTFASGKTPGPLELWSLSNAVKKLNKELTNGQGIKDLKTVARTCNVSKIVSDSMRDLMKRQGVSDSLLRRIENNPIYQSAISVITKPEPVTPDR